MNIDTPTTSANQSAFTPEFEDDIQNQGIMTRYNDPNNLIFNETTKELKSDNMIYDVIGVVFNPADSVRSNLPNNTSCILTLYGIYVIKVSELEVGTWLRCDVENKDCGVKYVIAAKPIFPPIHTRCIFKYNDAELLFFGKLKFDDQSKKFKCSFLGDLTPTFQDCSKNMEVFAEYMLNTEGKLEVKKALKDAEKTKIFKNFFLPTELSIVQTADNTMNSKVCVLWATNKLIDADFNINLKSEQKAASVFEALKTSPIKQSEKTTPVKQPKTSVFGNESSNSKTSPVKQPSVFNIDSKTSPIKQPSVFNVDSKTTPVKQINGSSVFTESSAPSKTSSIKQAGTQSMFENNCLPKTALSHQQAEQKPQMKQGFVKKAPLIKPNGTSNSDKQSESSNQVEQTSAKMNKISISSNKISLMAFSEQPKQSSAFNTHHEPEDLHAPKLPGESVFGSSFQQVSRDEVIRRPGPRPVPTRGGLYFPVVRANGRSRMLHGQRIEQVETEIKKSSSEESGSFEDDLDKYLSK